MIKKVNVGGVSFQYVRKGQMYNSYNSWDGRKGGFKASVLLNKDKAFWLSISHSKLDIRWNSLWDNMTWKSAEEAMKYFTEWTPENHKCLGTDFKQPTP